MSLRAIEKIADGFRFVTTDAGDLTLTSADIPESRRGSIAEAEAAAVDWIAENLGMFGAARLTSVVPLDGELWVSGKPIDLNDLQEP